MSMNLSQVYATLATGSHLEAAEVAEAAAAAGGAEALRWITADSHLLRAYRQLASAGSVLT